MLIPANAEHPLNAHQFINYILRPEIHASLTHKLFHANPKQEARKWVRPEVANNPAVALCAAELRKMVFPSPANHDVRLLIQRTFKACNPDL